MDEEKKGVNVTPKQAQKMYDAILKAGDDVWGKWLKLGGWIMEKRAAARVQADGKTRGSTYAAALKDVMGVFHPTFNHLSENGTVSYIDKCLTNLEAVDTFRNRIDASERPNYPKAVWQAYEASLRSDIDFQSAEDELEAEEAAGKRTRQTRDSTATRENELLDRIAELEEEVATLRAENAKLKEKLLRGVPPEARERVEAEQERLDAIREDVEAAENLKELEKDLGKMFPRKKGGRKQPQQ